jgi:hypothetical protein
MKRIQPEKIAEVGEWKAEKTGEEADVEDNVEMSTEGPTERLEVSSMLRASINEAEAQDQSP